MGDAGSGAAGVRLGRGADARARGGGAEHEFEWGAAGAVHVVAAGGAREAPNCYLVLISRENACSQ